ncbi:hypothetical protein [Lactobacillus sp. Sy-1]|uniref:hypothetical protein n=1 Tax=Lactobacillus sp. Sy-1 TaxID=2109645 RepID=UPI001C5A6EC8|nr:hypothetical protein [Lactobacillus sp. Sy-1]MBW1606146.1 hypothetical protein [Lactobacillus sp. Sy-1]
MIKKKILTLTMLLGLSVSLAVVSTNQSVNAATGISVNKTSVVSGRSGVRHHINRAPQNNGFHGGNNGNEFDRFKFIRAQRAKKAFDRAKLRLKHAKSAINTRRATHKFNQTKANLNNTQN